MNYLQNCCLIFLLPLMLVSCSETVNNRYKDTSHLEKPPSLEMTEKPKSAEGKQETEKKGLGESVLITHQGKNAVIKIKKTFSRSWTIVEQALQLMEIEITDKNREQGVFYVLFDPDNVDSEDSTFIDTMSFFLFKDEYKKASYKLSAGWKESSTQVKAELFDSDSIDLLDDDEDDFESSVDNGNKLLDALYNTIKNDLPID